MEQGAVFQSNRSQAVRLPKAVALPDGVKRVDVIAVGRPRNSDAVRRILGQLV